LSSYRSDGTKPYQPHPQFIEPQTLANRVLTFQERWFGDFPWLHYNPPIKGVLFSQASHLLAKEQMLPSLVQDLGTGEKPL
jgi:hypothetical protein